MREKLEGTVLTLDHDQRFPNFAGMLKHEIGRVRHPPLFWLT
jgi:hypothetical protein